MNQRPTRAPAPPDNSSRVLEGDPRDVADASFTEVERPNNLPATRPTNGNASPATKPRVEREAVTLPSTGFSNLAAGIAGVMAEIKPVVKSGWNDFHKYAYARMQDLSGALTPLMGKHGIVVFQNELDRDMFDDGRAMAIRYEFTIVHKSGEIWPERPVITGVSMCRTSNGKYDDKAFNKCHTSARKYFLLSLFQMPTDDEEDADRGPSNGGEHRPRPQGAPRRAPSPDGKVKPHLLPIIDGETPQEWRDRFVKAIAKATPAEVDGWYDANFTVFEKIKARKEFAAVYDDLLDVMDKQGAGTGEATERPDPISTGTEATIGKIEPAISADAKLWLDSLDNAFGACEDAESLAHEQTRLMTPMKGKAGEVAWNAAVDLVQSHLNRITEG